MSEIVKSFEGQVDNLETEFKAIDVSNKSSAKSFEAVVLELLAKLKRSQDKPGNENLEEDLEDLIYRVIVVLGELDLLEFD